MFDFRNFPLKAKYFFIAIILVSQTACGILDYESDKQVSSSLVDYLYSDREELDDLAKRNTQKAIPQINLPTRVGIAFVPQTHSYSKIEFTAVQQLELLQEAKKQFSKYQFIEHIEMIPTNYLQVKGGFDNLQQVANLYDIDLMALVSYDQIQKTYSKDSALLYLTIVGAHIIKGDDNHTQTFVDTAVFDVKTRSLLFRAPGTHKFRRNSTVNAKQFVQDKMSQKSFQLANQEMLLNLDNELTGFRHRVKNDKVAIINYKPSYSGGGSLGLLFLLLALLAWRFKFLQES